MSFQIQLLLKKEKYEYLVYPCHHHSLGAVNNDRFLYSEYLRVKRHTLLSGSKDEKIIYRLSPPLPRSKLSAAGWPRRQKVQRLRVGEGVVREKRDVRAGIGNRRVRKSERVGRREREEKEGAARQDGAQFIVSERERERRRQREEGPFS